MTYEAAWICEASNFVTARILALVGTVVLVHVFTVEKKGMVST
jgi:hypothetical protein